MSHPIDIDRLCLGCMSKLESKKQVCPVCGFSESSYTPSPHQLPPNTILNGKYLIGRVLGEGGFGITYLGWDLNLDMKVAVKEYYPVGYVTRESSSALSVASFTGDKREAFQIGLEKFIDEAKSLAKFYTLPGIVSVKDFFKENATAYIVMEYVEGITLKEYLKTHGRRVPVSQALELIKPLIRSLDQMHGVGIIHRDISPDNIMITQEGDIKLLDFGAARDISIDGAKSLSVLLKPGYAPEEQYRTRGQQGPWTDVYALSATLYMAITGETPPESMERMRRDTLVPPSRMGITITVTQETALLKGLAVFQENRYQDMVSFYRAIMSASEKEDGPRTLPLSGITGATNTEYIAGKAAYETQLPSRDKKNAKLFLTVMTAIIVLSLSVWGAIKMSSRDSLAPEDNGYETSTFPSPNGEPPESLAEQGSEANEPTGDSADSPKTQDSIPDVNNQPENTQLADGQVSSSPVSEDTSTPISTPAPTPEPTPEPTPTPTPKPTSAKEEKSYSGYVEFEISGKKYTFYSQRPLRFDSIEWNTYFYPKGSGYDGEYFGISLPKYISAGDTLTRHSIDFAPLLTYENAAGDLYLFPYNSGEFSTFELYSSSCSVIIEKWGGSGGTCSGTFQGELKLTNGDVILFSNGKFSVDIEDD